MKTIFKSIILMVFVGIAIVTVIKAGYTEETANISATVTVQSIQLTIDDASINYGTVPAGQSKSTCDVSDTQIVTNTGNVDEDFQIKGYNSIHWTLGTSAGNETYVHKFSTSSCPVTWGGTALTTSYQDLDLNVPVSGTTTLNLQITTPTDTNYFGSEAIQVTVLATAH